MEKQRRKGLVASGDGKARARLVAKWESILTTGYVVANQSPKAFILFFILIDGDGFCGCHLVAQKDSILFIFILWRRVQWSPRSRQMTVIFFIIFVILFFGRQSSCSRDLVANFFCFIFYIILNIGDGLVGSPLVARGYLVVVVSSPLFFRIFLI